MIRIFKKIIHGVNTLDLIAAEVKRSKNRASEVATMLEEEGFIVKERAGKSLRFTIADTEHVQKMRTLMFEQQGINFEEILANSQILFLAAMTDDWITLNQVARLSGITARTIMDYKKSLQNRGVIRKEKSFYRLNHTFWPHLYDFVVAYKKNAKIDGVVKWKFQDEILFEVDDEQLIEETTTGLYAYKDYCMHVGVISALCYLPKKKLSKWEIFVHSLFEVDDPRTLNLALTFYLKNKLEFEKVLPLAMKYGKYSMFTKMVTLLDGVEKKISLEGLPVFDRIDFYRIAKMYDVKGLKDPGSYERDIRRGYGHVRSS